MELVVIALPVLVITFIAVYRNQRDTEHLYRVPFGFDREFGPDSDRIRDELTMLVERKR